MAKEPRPGKVKTRLQPALGADEAAEIYRCLLMDRIEAMASLPPAADVALCFSPSAAESFFTSIAPPSFRLFPQSDGDLGRRLAAVFARSFATGYGAVSVIDSDSPELTTESVLRSFRLLRGGAGVTFGPSSDGGYYLVGLRKAPAGLFDGIPWSTPQVLPVSLRRARELGLEPVLLESREDIDCIADLAGFFHRRSALRQKEILPGYRTFRFAAALHRAGRLGSSGSNGPP